MAVVVFVILLLPRIIPFREVRQLRMRMLEDLAGNVLYLPAMPMQQTKVRPAAARTTHKFLVVHRIIIRNLDIRDKVIVVELIDDKRDQDDW